MCISRLYQIIAASLLFCFGISENISAQTSTDLPKYPVKSAIINYNIKHAPPNDTLSHPFLRESFDLYGAQISKEYIDELSIEMHGEPYREIFKNGFLYKVDNPKGCATKSKILDYSYRMCVDGGFIKLVQDLIHGKINKTNEKSFQSFTKTGTVTFLGFTCDKYAYNIFNFALSSKDKMEFIVYHDICLSDKYYLGGNLLSTIEATSFEENISIPPSVFEVPQQYRIIDGDKLESTIDKSVPEFSTIIVEYNTKRDYGQTKEEGKKTIYIKDGGKASAQDWEGTLAEYGLPPENKHFKDIRDEEFEYHIDYGNKTVHKRNLVDGNYNDKSVAELNYFFGNMLYDNSVNLLGTTNFMGKDCQIFEIRIGVEKLEVYVWHGIFLKTKRFICTGGDNCPQPLLMFEETAVRIHENASINQSVFQYPENYELINN